MKYEGHVNRNLNRSGIHISSNVSSSEGPWDAGTGAFEGTAPAAGTTPDLAAALKRSRAEGAPPDIPGVPEALTGETWAFCEVL